MKIIVCKDYDEMSVVAKDIVKDVVLNNPNAVLGLATGSTPIKMYDLLADEFKKGVISFKNIKTVNLDEYVGLDESSDQSYVYFMRDNLFNKVDIDLNNTNLPNGKASDIDKECLRYSKLVFDNTQDIQVLGIGSNGHIGFNEPGTSFDSITHRVKLTENTIKDNSRLFNSIDEVPKEALTMGMKEIMQSKKVLLMASGKNKAQAIFNTVKGTPNESCPASILQNHSDCILVIDEEAASLL